MYDLLRYSVRGDVTWNCQGSLTERRGQLLGAFCITNVDCDGGTSLAKSHRGRASEPACCAGDDRYSSEEIIEMIDWRHNFYMPSTMALKRGVSRIESKSGSCNSHSL